MKKINLLLILVLLVGCTAKAATDVADRTVYIDSVQRAGYDWQNGICQYHINGADTVLNGCIGDDFKKTAGNVNNTGNANGSISGGCLAVNEHGTFEIHTMRIEGEYVNGANKLCYLFKHV